MKAGPLRHRITIQNRAAGVDGYGQANGAWTAVRTVWAECLDLQGRELIAAREISASVTAQIRLRGYTGWRTELKGASRIVFGSRTFEVEAPPINPDGRDRELVVYVKEVVG